MLTSEGLKGPKRADKPPAGRSVLTSLLQASVLTMLFFLRVFASLLAEETFEFPGEVFAGGEVP